MTNAVRHPLQDMLVRKVFRRDIARPQHFVPTVEGFGAAARLGLQSLLRRCCG
jgi:hypothetical protein